MGFPELAGNGPGNHVICWGEDTEERTLPSSKTSFMPQWPHLGTVITEMVSVGCGARWPCSHAVSSPWPSCSMSLGLTLLICTTEHDNRTYSSNDIECFSAVTGPL